MTLASGAKESSLSGHPVVEPGAQRDQQITALQCRHRGDGAVHARHAQVLLVAVREGARAPSAW